MKDITEIRHALANIHTFRNMAVVAVNERDKNTLLNKLKDIDRQIALIRSIVESQP